MLVFLYLVIGIFTLYGAATLHLLRAESKGYKAIKWWNENVPLSEIYNLRTVPGFILGMLIWPIRLYKFYNMIPMYYELYERR